MCRKELASGVPGLDSSCRERGQIRVFMNTVMLHFRFRKTWQISRLAKCVGFSRKSLLYGVTKGIRRSCVLFISLLPDKVLR